MSGSGLQVREDPGPTAYLGVFPPRVAVDSSHRFGAKLILEGLITEEQLSAALQRQLAAMGRLGTNLIELGILDEDTVSMALSRRHGVPAVFRRDFEHIDPTVLARLPSRAAAMYRAIPLRADASRAHAVCVAMMDPVNMLAVDELGILLSARVTPLVAPEFVILGMLEKLYGVRQLRRPGSSPPPSRAAVGLGGTWVMASPPLAGTPPRAAEPASDLRKTQPSRVRPGQEESARGAIAAPIEARPVIAVGSRDVQRTLSSPPAPRVTEPCPPEPAPTMPIEEVLAHLSSSDDRDQIGELVTAYLAAHFGCGLLLVVKDGLGLGWRGHALGVGRDVIESIVVPLNVPSAFQVAFVEHRVFCGPPPEAGEPIHSRLWRLLHTPPPSEVIVAPIAIGARIINLIYAHPKDAGALAVEAASDLEQLSDAAADAYRRAIQRRHGQ